MNFSWQDTVVAIQWEGQTLYLVIELTVIGKKGTIRLSGTNLNQNDFGDVEGMEKPNMNFKIDHQFLSIIHIFNTNNVKFSTFLHG